MLITKVSELVLAGLSLRSTWQILTILATFPHFRSDCTAKEWGTLSMVMVLTCITRSFSLSTSETQQTLSLKHNADILFNNITRFIVSVFDWNVTCWLWYYWLISFYPALITSAENKLFVEMYKVITVINDYEKQPLFSFRIAYANKTSTITPRTFIRAVSWVNFDFMSF